MRGAAGVLVATVAAATLGIILAMALGAMTPVLAWVALIGGAVTGALAFRQMPRPAVQERIHPVEWALIGAFALAGLRAFLWLLYPDGEEWKILSPNNLGDLSLHLDFIRYFANGVPFWPDNPIFAGEPLRYPLGADFFNSLLLAAGLPVEQSLVWVGLGGSTLTAFALWRWGRGFALAAFLFAGGLAGFALAREWLETGKIVFEDVQAQMAWKNLFLALFVTQRGFLIALPAGLLLLDDWRSRYLRGTTPLLPLWASLLLYATLPLFSLHSFLYLSIALLGMFAFAASKKARVESMVHVAIAFLPATICFALVTGGFGTTGGMHWQPGWLQADAITDTDVTPGQKLWAQIWFWPDNFGLYGLLWLGLAAWAIARGPNEQRAILVPATVMFIACAFYSFAVWPWDNTKILIWAWLAVAPCLWTAIGQPLPLTGRAVLCVVMFFTGAVSLIGGLDKRHGYGLVRREFVDNTAAAVQSLEPGATFACAPVYAHPLILLGRKIAVGYDGHLWSHGIDYRDSRDLLDDLMDGMPGWEDAARKLNVDYLYWGRDERKEFFGSERPWRSLPVAFKGEGFVIYDLRGLKN